MSHLPCERLDWESYWISNLLEGQECDNSAVVSHSLRLAGDS